MALLSSFAPENVASRDRFAGAVPRQPPDHSSFHKAECGAYLRDSLSYSTTCT